MASKNETLIDILVEESQGQTMIAPRGAIYRQSNTRSHVEAKMTETETGSH